ncbi:hypothetical protein C2E21_0568 [Chlorella sorokiniana]|uniref:Nucleotide-diphospho-sugar transferase domain-containing protein n=1 Tax=Chlorella sorokiniana TaxID=3076 RepID=A0A2P6U437_CHLSO|nr:hypothetical protein C2E21_0568 [Chlorella sorokiniana]|eukprot:PRW61069.1 hypothetical protein C2E21_0568 [Chlorella sorokiniana]
MARRRGLLLALLYTAIACAAAPHAGPHRAGLPDDALQGGRRHLAAGTRCPPVSRDVLAARAQNNTLMFAMMNEAQWDFGRNWMHHVKKAGISYYLAVAADVPTSEALVAAGEPCVERIDEEADKLGLAWGQEGWRRMTWSKVFFMDSVVDWGFNWVVSDADVVWFRDPTPLFAKYPAADFLFSEDGAGSRNDKGDDGVEHGGSEHSNFNTGVYLLRGGASSAAFIHAWAGAFEKCGKGLNDQTCAYELMRTPDQREELKEERGLWRVWNKRIVIGIIPPSQFLSAHTLHLQRYDQARLVKGVPAYAVHMTWTYKSHPGKRARLRDMGLWVVDPPEFFQGSFVTVDLFGTPELPPHYNEWNENEDMVAFHLAAIHQQLQQAYVGMALAVASNRSFILPQFKCFCDHIWYSVVRCRVVDAQEMPFPVPCPQDYLFDPDRYTDDAGPLPPMHIRPAGFLANERTPAEVKDSVLTLRPSAALTCTDCVQLGKATDGSPVLEVPPSLTDAQLLPLLEPYRRYRVWKLSMDSVGSPQRAFGGFADAAAAANFDGRMERITGEWCCRREEELARYRMEGQQHPKLRMNPQFNYSSMAAARGSTA